jgi:hypothetical protein
MNLLNEYIKLSHEKLNRSELNFYSLHKLLESYQVSNKHSKRTPSRELSRRINVTSSCIGNTNGTELCTHIAIKHFYFFKRHGKPRGKRDSCVDRQYCEQVFV